jgi:hypothetical protein
MPNPASRSSGYELVQQNWQYPQYRQSGCIGTSEIPVWCETPDQVEETIEAMIAESEIQPADRARCVFWEWAAFAPGTHEALLDRLEDSEENTGRLPYARAATGRPGC